MPEYFLTKKYPTGLDEIFTVCWWEMRGAGLSYRPGMSPESTTVEQIIEDTIEVANFLRDRFKQDKIYMMAHSGGTFFGIQSVARAPSLFRAYVGVGQMTLQVRSENLAYQYMVNEYQMKGNRRMYRKLVEAPPGESMPLPTRYMAIRDKAMHGLGIGTTRNMRSVFTGIFLPIWLSPFYTIREKRAIWKGKKFSRKTLWDEVFSTDLTKKIIEIPVPVYLCSGIYDYTVSCSEARAYLKKVRAPIKGFYIFENSAHSPMFEEPERMCKIMSEDVINGRNLLADEK